MKAFVVLFFFSSSSLVFVSILFSLISAHCTSICFSTIDARIKYKISSLCIGAIISTGPGYLFDLLKIYTPSRQLRSSSDNRILCVPSDNTKSYGERPPNKEHNIHKDTLTHNALAYTAHTHTVCKH